MFLRETFLLVESETRGGERLPPHATRIAHVPSRKMVVSLPWRGSGRGGPPFRDRERNPRLVSNSSNNALAVSVSRLPPSPGQPAIASLLLLPALPLPPLLPTIVVYMDDLAALAIGSEPDPFSGRISANDAAAKLT